MAFRLSYWLYWPARMLLELFVVGMFLAALTQLERQGRLDFLYFEVPDWIRIHALYALAVFWLSRWRPWTIWFTGTLYVLGMLMLTMLSGALFMPFPQFVFAFALIIYAAYRLGKSQHRKRPT